MPQTLHFPDAVPTLFGDMVYLRELTEDDVPAWFERASDTESAVLAGDPIPDSVEMGFHWLQRHRERFRQQAGIRWAIVPKESTDPTRLTTRPPSKWTTEQSTSCPRDTGSCLRPNGTECSCRTPTK